ncbi:MAG: DUF533 domain-containing protein [Pseudomonadota bacterium]
MDFSRILGAVLQGAVQPPRRTTRGRRAQSIPGFGTSRSANAQLARALTGLATVAIEALSNRQSTPEPSPAPRRRVPDMRAPEQAPERAPQESVPRTGSSPWTPRPAPPAPPPEAETAEALLMIRAMIAAARADGVIDAAERTALMLTADDMRKFGHEHPLGPTWRGYQDIDPAVLTRERVLKFLADFDAPLTPAALAKEVRDPMQAAQLYAGAFAAMGEVSEAERAWLQAFARALKLDRDAASAIEARLGG